MSNHPYPDDVVTAVSDAIENLYSNATTWEQIEAADDTVAEVALQALWDASRVDSAEGLERVADSAIILTKTGGTHWAQTMKLLTGKAHYPAHLLHWGDNDE